MIETRCVGCMRDIRYSASECVERKRERSEIEKRESNLRPGLSKTGRIFCTKKRSKEK